MKGTLLLMLVLVPALALANRSEAQSLSNPFEIDIQGPWILYVDNSFTVNNIKIPVLVLMAPDVMNSPNPHYNHDQPIFSGGDGVPLQQQMIYCVQFVATPTSHCRPESHGKAPSGKFLHVSAQKDWKWYGTSDLDRKGNTYIILPLPDNYVSDGVWYTSLGTTYDPAGRSYSSQQASIGLYLRYSNAAATVQLLSCTPPAPGGTLDGGACTNNQYSFANSGSLRIEMKAPDTNNACDFHVRYAYSQMLTLLDGRNLHDPNAGNLNYTIGYIAPAISFANGKPGYDGQNGNLPLCSDCDPQNPNFPKTCPNPPMQPSLAQTHSVGEDENGDLDKPQKKPTIFDKSDLLAAVETVLRGIKEVREAQPHEGGKPAPICLRDDHGVALPDPYFGCNFDNFKNVIKKSPDQPTYSQFAVFNDLLKTSIEQLRLLRNPAAQPAADFIVPANQTDGLITSEENYLDVYPTKNGNDCRAEVLVAAPQ